eukprot:gene3514-6137_t
MSPVLKPFYTTTRAMLVVALASILLICKPSYAIGSVQSVCYAGFQPFNAKSCQGLIPQTNIKSPEECAMYCFENSLSCLTWTFSPKDKVCSIGYCTEVFWPDDSSIIGCMRIIPNQISTRETATLLPVSARHIARLTLKSNPVVAVLNDTAISIIAYNDTKLTVLRTPNQTAALPQTASVVGVAVVGLTDKRCPIFIPDHFNRNNSWVALTSDTLPDLANHLAATTSNDTIFIGFGENATTQTAVNKIWSSCDGGWSWSSIDSPTASRDWPFRKPAMIALGEHLIVLGGLREDFSDIKVVSLSCRSDIDFNSPSFILKLLRLQAIQSSIYNMVGLTCMFEAPPAIALSPELAIVGCTTETPLFLLNVQMNGTILRFFPFGYRTWEQNTASVASSSDGLALVTDMRNGSAWSYSMDHPPQPPKTSSGPWSRKHAFAIVVGVFIIIATILAVVVFFMPKKKKEKKHSDESQQVLLAFE